MAVSRAEVTELLQQWSVGRQDALEEVLPAIYAELRKLAASYLRRERRDHTLQATALVHEAYLRLVDVEQPQQWDGREHFFAAAAEAMRRILIDRARHRLSFKAGGDRRRLELDALNHADGQKDDQLLALDEALSDLEGHNRQAAQLVKLRYFAGLTHQQAAEALGISRTAADRLWALARAWLYREISSD